MWKRTRSLSSDLRPRWTEWAGHILQEAELLVEKLGDPANLDLLEDRFTVRAVERSLQIISEATVRLLRAGADLAALEPGVDWRGWRDFGNFLRHEYDRLQPAVVQHALVTEVVPLRAAALRLKSRFEAEAS